MNIKSQLKWFGMLTGIILSSSILVSCDQLFKTDNTDETSTDDGRTRLIIGKGYDVTGRYAYSPEIKPAILDYDALNSANMIFRDTNLSEANFTTTSGSTITAYQSSLTSKTNLAASVKYEGASFSGEVKSNFEETKYSSEDYSFATSKSRIVKDSFFVDQRNDPIALQKFVTASFMADLATAQPSAIIEKYGTHVMLGGIWGARLDYNMSAKKISEKAGSKIGSYAQAKAEATYGSFTGSVDGSASVDTEYKDDFDTSSVQTDTNAYGGLVEYARDVHDKGSYDKWIESIDANQIWCDYYADSLQPIYTFIADDAKRAELQAAYETYLAGKVITVTSSDIPFIATTDFENDDFMEKTQDDPLKSNRLGSPINYEYTFTISKKDITNLEVTIKLKVIEQDDWDPRTYEGETKVTVPVNKNISSIDLNNILTYTATGTMDVQGKLTPIAHTCPFIASPLYLSVLLGRQDYLGIKGTLQIPIHYRP